MHIPYVQRIVTAASLLDAFLRATAVPVGTAERTCISYGNYVRLSVRLSGVSRPGTESSPGEIETPDFHHMVA